MDIAKLISVDKEILNGQPVFAGTRVPIETLFDHLEAGITLDEFLDDFPSVEKIQAVALLDIASQLFQSKNIEKLHAVIA